MSPKPFTQIVHDRAVVEVLRGCIRGCRFCQAGFIYRPFREKSVDTIKHETKCLCEQTGYEQVSLSSLSTSDHTKIAKLLSDLSDYTDKENINLSLPSLRIDSFSDELLEKIKAVRKSGLTFAPEAGTQRLRDVINKNLTEEEILDLPMGAYLMTLETGIRFLGDYLNAVRNPVGTFPGVKREEDQAPLLPVNQGAVLLAEYGMFFGNFESGEGNAAGKNVAAEFGKLIGKIQFGKGVTGSESIIAD